MNEQLSERQIRDSVAIPPAPKPARRSRWRLVPWLLVVVAAVAAIVWVARPREAPPPRAGRFALSGPMVVVPEAARKGDIPIILNALGTVTPLATVTVKTQISGQLTEVGFKEGQTVQQGDFLAQIDPRPYQLALGQAEGQLLKDQALLRNAQVDLARYRTLVAQDSLARQQLDTQASLVAQYQGVVRTDQALVDNAKLNLQYCRITAPVTGRVGLRLVDQGNYVQVGEATGLVVITQMQPITVVFPLPEDNLPAIVKRMRAGAELAVTAYDRTQTTKLATGTLTTIDNQIDATTGTFKLKAQFANDDEGLFPNQFVNVQLLVDTLHDVTTIPTSAVQRGAPGTFVYLVKADDTVTVRPVKLGPSAGERIAVESGLAPGDKVVVDGADKLKEGAKIALPGASQPGAAQPGAAKPAGANPAEGANGGGRRKRGSATTTPPAQ
jgi:multidrug efflux system membrane fusion protein